MVEFKGSSRRDGSKARGRNMNEIFCVTMQIDMKYGTTYMDCTCQFPVRSIDGTATMFIVYDWSSNSF